MQSVDSRRWIGLLGATLAGAVGLALWRRQSSPSPLSHLVPGRLWEYDLLPGPGTETVEIVETFPLADGRQAFRVEYRRHDTVLDAVFSHNARGHLIQLSQSGDSATFDPPLVGLGDLRVGAYWSTRSAMIFPSKFRASTPTEVSGRVVGFEKVTVPAGTFRAYRIEAVTNGRASTGWHVPALGLVRELSWEEELVLRRVVDV